MGQLQTNAADCDHKEYERETTEQFMHKLDDEGLKSEILRDV